MTGNFEQRLWSELQHVCHHREVHVEISHRRVRGIASQARQLNRDESELFGCTPQRVGSRSCTLGCAKDSGNLVATR